MLCVLVSFIFNVFILFVIHPLHTDAIGPRNRGGAPMGSVMEGDRSKLEEALVRGEGRATLKMRRDGQAVVEEVVCGKDVVTLQHLCLSF